MTTDDLRRALAAAREELEQATRALAPRHLGGEMARYKAASARCHALERELAKSLGQEYAVRLEWPHPWDTGAPMPQVLSSGHVVLLLYSVAEPDPDWDGTYVNVIDAAGAHGLAIVQFKHCIIHKFGGPNDEVFSGHPLYERGLEPYGAHVVENSSWISEQQTINKVHSRYSPERWEGLKHYLLLFHDEVFECIAKGFAINSKRTTFPEALRSCVARLLR